VTRPGPRLRALVACATFAVTAVSCRGASGPEVTILTDDGPVRVGVELATTHDEQARGLMWRDELDEDRGMLFVFRRQRPRSFWMKNTPLPLDIIYIGGDRKIVSIAEHTTPYSTAAIPSAGPARYVLEVGAGFCRTHGVRAGATVELPTEAIAAAGARSSNDGDARDP